MLESIHITKRIGLEIREALESGDMQAFGALLHRHWENKKSRSARITTPGTEQIYMRARECGAVGGKLVGAGGGGFLLLFCPRERKADVRAEMARHALREVPFAFEYDGAKIVFNV